MKLCKNVLKPNFEDGDFSPENQSILIFSRRPSSWLSPFFASFFYSLQPISLCISCRPKEKEKRRKMNESKRKQLIVYFGLVPGAGCSFDLLEDQGCLPNLRPVEDNGQLTLFSETHTPQSTFLF